MIADWLTSSGLAAAKPFLTALVVPPVPLLVLALIGAWAARAHPRAGRSLVVLACAGLWLSQCSGSANWMERSLLSDPPALTADDRRALKRQAEAGTPMAIVVLGGGVDDLAPEYGAANLKRDSMARLRYGLWLARQTGIALAASGGRGWAASQGTALPAEADVMAAIARSEFGQTVRWTEDTSRDTHENAAHTVALLGAAGIRELLVVTDGWHMPRALREFQAASTASGLHLDVRPAPIGLPVSGDQAASLWMPTGEGALRCRAVLREVLGAWLVPR